MPNSSSPCYGWSSPRFVFILVYVTSLPLCAVLASVLVFVVHSALFLATFMATPRLRPTRLRLPLRLIGLAVVVRAATRAALHRLPTRLNTFRHLRAARMCGRRAWAGRMPAATRIVGVRPGAAPRRALRAPCMSRGMSRRCVCVCVRARARVMTAAPPCQARAMHARCVRTPLRWVCGARGHLSRGASSCDRHTTPRVRATRV